MQPTQIGPYLIHRLIGRGGMGAVYEAEDPMSGEVVAVKVLAAHLGDNATLRRRFETEIETLKALRHPGIVRLLAFGEDDGLPYFAMELVRGRSLEDLIRAGRRFTWQETVSIATEIAAALKAAHDQGIVHRDLKPANLLFLDEPHPGSGSVKLADFGIARLFGDGGQTQAGTVVGTVEYMAPEQAAGQPVDHRGDLYALGLVMFAMLAGRPPFQGKQSHQVLDRQRCEVPPRLSTLAQEVPSDLDKLIARLLEKEPAKRPANALALSRLLGAIVALDAAPAPTMPAIDPSATPNDGGLLAQTRPGTVPPPPRPAVAPNGGTERMTPPDAATSHLQPEGSSWAADVAAFDRQSTTPNLDRVDRKSARQTRHTTVEEERSAREALAAREQFWETTLRVLSALGIAVVVAGGAWMMTRRPGPDELQRDVMAAIAANPDRIDGLKDAYPIAENFLAWYPDDPRAEEMRSLQREVDVERLRKQVDLKMKLSKPPHLRVEHEYRQAMALKALDSAACQRALEDILRLPPDLLTNVVTPGAEEAEPGVPDKDLFNQPAVWLSLVRQQLDVLRTLDAVERRVLRQDSAFERR
jgi:serine/threonine-protein kinase